MTLRLLVSATERMDLPFVTVEGLGFGEIETEFDLRCVKFEVIFW